MLGVDQAYDENEEADDIIGSLVKEFAFSKSGIIIVSNDYDFFQLVDERTMLYWSRKDTDTVWSYNKILEEYGITPQQFIDVYSLAGDKTDNIIGVEGIGEKTAIKLIKEYGTIEKIMESNIKKSQKIREQKDLIMKNRQLVRIKTDLPINLIRGRLELDTAKDMFANWLKFNSLLDRWDEVEKLGKKIGQMKL
jgi:DNA polymerase-1